MSGSSGHTVRSRCLQWQVRAAAPIFTHGSLIEKGQKKAAYARVRSVPNKEKKLEKPIRRSLGRFCFAQTLIDAPIEEGGDNDGAKQGYDGSSSDKDEKACQHDEEEDTEQSESDLFVSRQTKGRTCAAVPRWRGTRRLVVLLDKLVFHTLLLTHYALFRSVSARACLLRRFMERHALETHGKCFLPHSLDTHQPGR